MQSQFKAAGLKTVCLTGQSSDEDRRTAPRRLASGELCAIVTVDLYNEGVDLSDVDTLLFLRPTQSPLLFSAAIGPRVTIGAEQEQLSCTGFCWPTSRRISIRQTFVIHYRAKQKGAPAGSRCRIQQFTQWLPYSPGITGTRAGTE